MKTPFTKNAVRSSALLMTFLALSFVVYVLAQESIFDKGAETSTTANASNGIQDLGIIFDYIKFYRLNHAGKYPGSTSDVIEEIGHLPGIKSEQDYEKALASLLNPDSIFADDEFQRSNPTKSSPYTITNIRPNSNLVGTPKFAGMLDVLSYTDIYLHEVQKSKTDSLRLSGFYLVLYDNGEVEKIPYDQVSYAPVTEGSIVTFPRQAGVPWNALSFEEFWLTRNLSVPAFVRSSKDGANTSNGGFEGLVQLSRFVSHPGIHGVERDDLQKMLNSAQDEFTLTDIQSGATKLGINTQVQKQTLSQLQKSGTPALLFLQDDGRIVTLTAIDNDRAVVIDRGLTRNVERSILEKRYSSEALVPTKALTQNAAIVADDAVREVKLTSLEAEVSQQFTLRNTGTQPITLQLEYPLLGVTESKLSKGVIAPGETATLDLKVKWRSILRVPYQNVLVSIQTNDPIVPRLQLAILLTPPKGAGK